MIEEHNELMPYVILYTLEEGGTFQAMWTNDANDVKESMDEYREHGRIKNPNRFFSGIEYIYPHIVIASKTTQILINMPEEGAGKDVHDSES